MILASGLLEQILKGGSLSDKLAGIHIPASQWQFEPMSLPIEVPDQPGRSGSLAPRLNDPPARLPKKSELMGRDSDRHRGRLLHFFANHELLAIETMAFTLLRFPQAPLEFKQGVLRILKEEQAHLQSYLNRMAQYGVDLGEVPLNFYFWNSLKSLQSPFDFVTRMSLTFEQANLDFALDYARLFESELGDVDTRDLLRKVHDDEVRHVAHGWYWFNQWRDPRWTSWEAYRRSLPFPMSARRARGGAVFAADSRRAAGMSEEFVESVRITGGSRGRVPELYFFNPQAELEAGGIQISSAAKKKLLDFEWILFWMAQEEDLVYLSRPDSKAPPQSWLREVFDWKGEIPEWIQKGEEITRPLQKIKPWAWSRSAFELQSQLQSVVKSKCPPSREQTHQKWLSKSWWAEQLQGESFRVDSREQVEACILTGTEAKPEIEEWILKGAHSTSGRGHRVLRRGAPLPQEVLIPASGAVLQPFHKKLADFSVQYQISERGDIKRFEPRLFETDSRFQYVGTDLGVPSDPVRKGYWERIREEEPQWRPDHERVLQILRGQGYVGPLGIDGLLATEAGGAGRVVSVIEVNVRYTLGRLAIEIERFLKKRAAHGKMSIMTSLSGPEDAKRALQNLQHEFQGRVISITPVERVHRSWIYVTY